jgi:hypothetical protein
MKQTADFTIFIYPKIEKQLENGPLLKATGQVIVYKTLDGKWGTDEICLLDIDEVVLMGVEIKDRKEIQTLLDHFKNMGINLSKIMDKEIDILVSGNESVEQFVFEQVGIKLP